MLYPSAKYRSVQKVLDPIKNEGFSIAYKINWDEYEIEKGSEIDNRISNMWSIGKNQDNEYQMIRNVFRSGRLVLVISKKDSIPYVCKYYPVYNSKPEYLYIAP